MKYTVMKYLRLSAEDIDLDGLEKYESNSIANQRAYLDDFISKMPEFEGCEILEAIDDGRTGTNFQRPGVQQVLELAERGKINCVVVKDLSRFGRNYIEVGDYLEQKFPAWGVRFVSVADMYDSSSYEGTTGGINIAFRNLIAEMYSQDLAEKVRSAKDTLNKHGKISASYSFYGYVIDPDDRHRLLIDEPAAEIVRHIFNLYEQGLSVRKIARKLNEDGVQTASERKKEQGAKREWLRNGKVSMWDGSIITRIIADERYTGTHIYGKKRSIELGKRGSKAVPKSEWIIVPGAIPAIITGAQFERVKALRAMNTPSMSAKQSGSGSAILSRKIFCGGCGKSLARRKAAGGGYTYCCSTRSVKNGLDCMTGSVRESAITEAVLTVIKQQAMLAANIKIVRMANSKTAAVTVDSLRGEIQKLKKIAEQMKSSKLALWEKFNGGDILREAYQAESEKLTAQTVVYADKISELENQVQTLQQEAGQENTFVERFSKQVGIQELTQAVVDEFIAAVNVYAPDRIEIKLNYADEFDTIVAQTGS